MRNIDTTTFLAAALLIVSCAPAPGEEATPEDVYTEEKAEDYIDASPTPPPLRVVTFNTGTSLKPSADDGENRGYGRDQWAACDEWYGNGLAWKPIVEDTRAWFAAVDPDIVALQEVFWPGECPDIPEEFWPGFVCEDWTAGYPTVAEQILGNGWQIMCHPGRPDKCAAVNRRVGSFRGCDEDLCLEGMAGYPIEDCGSAVRIARATIDLVDGGVLTLVSIHAKPGMTEEDMACRVLNYKQLFEDMGDGAPAANGEWNLIMGDFNVDPVVMAGLDPSADTVLEYVGDGKPFHFITASAPDSPATYAGYVRIDHVVSDAYSGTCWHAGVTEGHPPVTPAVSFDHHAAVCDIMATR